jgi:hypothetical protein
VLNGGGVVVFDRLLQPIAKQKKKTLAFKALLRQRIKALLRALRLYSQLNGVVVFDGLLLLQPTCPQTRLAFKALLRLY